MLPQIKSKHSKKSTKHSWWGTEKHSWSFSCCFPNYPGHNYGTTIDLIIIIIVRFMGIADHKPGDWLVGLSTIYSFKHVLTWQVRGFDWVLAPVTHQYLNTLPKNLTSSQVYEWKLLTLRRNKIESGGISITPVCRPFFIFSDTQA